MKLQKEDAALQVSGCRCTWGLLLWLGQWEWPFGQQEGSSNWESVSPTTWAVGASQQAAQHQRWQERDQAGPLWDPTASKARTFKCSTGTGKVSVYQVGKWKLLWWWRLEAGDFWPWGWRPLLPMQICNYEIDSVLWQLPGWEPCPVRHLSQLNLNHWQEEMVSDGVGRLPTCGEWRPLSANLTCCLENFAAC